APDFPPPRKVSDLQRSINSTHDGAHSEPRAFFPASFLDRYLPWHCAGWPQSCARSSCRTFSAVSLWCELFWLDNLKFRCFDVSNFFAPSGGDACSVTIDFAIDGATVAFRSNYHLINAFDVIDLFQEHPGGSGLPD